MVRKLKFKKIDPYDWLCGPGSPILFSDRFPKDWWLEIIYASRKSAYKWLLRDTLGKEVFLQTRTPKLLRKQNEKDT